ncbi:hypothetical protein LA03_05980 [Burkholderia gladioli]|uniref:hypothetical protein n=1 Tax=Burkholderia gladioli TaxID=28095 RepID=UPI00050E2623|nr:hypothetical protein [Burkholderia gladioli]KGE11116.1 hypothetical protein LA03_05980 [Burkholderia gladioli]
MARLLGATTRQYQRWEAGSHDMPGPHWDGLQRAWAWTRPEHDYQVLRAWSDDPYARMLGSLRVERIGIRFGRSQWP